MQGEGDINPPELIYGANESRYQSGVCQSEWVDEAARQQCQYQQRSGI